MSKEPTILFNAPVIFTKDANWLNIWGKNARIEAGAIILLPDDAILYVPPFTEQKVVKPPKQERK